MLQVVVKVGIVYTPPPPSAKFSKRGGGGGLTGPQLLEGFARKEEGDVFPMREGGAVVT